MNVAGYSIVGGGGTSKSSTMMKLNLGRNRQYGKHDLLYSCATKKSNIINHRHDDDADDNTSVTSVTSCDSDSSTIRAMKITVRKFDSLCESLDDDVVDDDVEVNEYRNNDDEYELWTDDEDEDVFLQNALAPPSTDLLQLTSSQVQSKSSLYVETKETDDNDFFNSKKRNLHREVMKMDSDSIHSLGSMDTTGSLSTVTLNEDDFDDDCEQAFDDTKIKNSEESKKSAGAATSKSRRDGVNDDDDDDDYLSSTITGNCFFSVPVSLFSKRRSITGIPCMDMVLEHQFENWIPRWWLPPKNINRSYDGTGATQSDDDDGQQKGEDEAVRAEEENVTYIFERKRWWNHPRDEDIHNIFLQM